MRKNLNWEKMSKIRETPKNETKKEHPGIRGMGILVRREGEAPIKMKPVSFKEVCLLGRPL
jgi:hypothetical protein